MDRVQRSGRRGHGQALLGDLADLVAVRSVSSDSSRARDCRRAADWLVGRLRRAGVRHVDLVHAGGPPLVIGSTVCSGAAQSGPHVLVYAHYDVQPAGPENRWTSPPFRLTAEGSWVVERGAADDKGPLLAHVHALEALISSGGPAPRVTLVADGEEEVGSPHLAAGLRELASEQRPDAVVVSDTRMAGPLQPTLVRSLRGSVTLDVLVRTAHAGGHAGALGGQARGAAGELAAALASLHDRSGRVVVPGFRRGAQPVLPLGGPTSTEPAVTVTRLRAGSPAAAVPDRAAARLNIRTALGQDPRAVALTVVRHLRCQLPASSRLRVRAGAAVPAVEADVAGPAALAAARAARDAFGAVPIVTRSGGTIAAVGLLRAAFGAPVVLLGFTPPDSRSHAPDERMHVPTLQRAVLAASRYPGHLSAVLAAG